MRPCIGAFVILIVVVGGVLYLIQRTLDPLDENSAYLIES